jgi:hypothetical protein
MESNSCGGRASARSLERTARRGSVLRGGACALLAGTLAACGGTVRQTVAGPTTDLAVRQSTQCVTESYPAALPSPEALMNTQALARDLRTLLAGAELPAGEATLTLWYDAEGTNVRRDLLRSTLPPALADSVQELVFAALGRAPAMEHAWGARLTVAVGERVAFAVAHRQYCPPRPRSRTIEAEMAQFQDTGVRYRGGVRERMVLMQVTVHPAGYVEDARVLRGGAPGSTLEKQIRDDLRTQIFIPASLDGVPVQGDLAVPIRLRG